MRSEKYLCPLCFCNKLRANPFFERIHVRFKSMNWKFLSIFFCVLLLNARCGYAQIGIGGGFEYGTAAFISKSVFVRRPSMAISGMLSIAPRDSKIFPSFTYLLKNMVVSVANSYYAGQTGTATDQHFALNLNYRTALEGDYYQYFIGGGIARISPRKTLNDQWGNPIILIDSAGSENIYPLIQLGAKYMHRILSNSSFYFGVEANLKYIRMHSENVYALQYGAASAPATISGDVIFPGILLHLNYIFDRKEE